jgi:hypothetical protein
MLALSRGLSRSLSRGLIGSSEGDYIRGFQIPDFLKEIKYVLKSLGMHQGSG